VSLFSQYLTTYAVSNRAIFNDLEQPQTHVSRSGHYLTLNVFEMAKDTAIITINVKNFHGSLTTVVRAQNDTSKTAKFNITDTIFDRTLV